MTKQAIVTILLTLVGFAGYAQNPANDNNPQPKEHTIIGVWMLESETAPDGRTTPSIYSQYTRCKIYDADSTYYTVQLHAVGEDMMIIAHEKGRYRLNDSLYMERDRVMPFEWVNDSTFITDFMGYKERMVRSTTMTEERKQEIRDLVNKYPNDGDAPVKHFVLSTTERPVVVADAMKQVENEFFRSEYYLDLRRHIEAGNNIRPEEWKELERRLKMVYPRFSSSLYGLFNLSPTEYQLCMLLKIRSTPSEIAMVLNKDKSTISSIRRRLYKKVFDKDGSGKDWDEFILSL